MSSSIKEEIYLISNSSNEVVKETTSTLFIHLEDIDLKPILISVYIRRDYVSEHSELKEIEAHLPLGDFVYNLYPYRDKLKATLITYITGNKEVREYTFMLSQVDDKVKSRDYTSVSQEELNKHITYFKGQCINSTIEKLRNNVVSGVFRNTSLDSVIATTLFKRFSNLGLTMVSNDVKVVPISNSRVYYNVVIPNNTKLLSLPNFLQNNKSYGLYNGGANIFIQYIDDVNTMFMYPIYRHDLFDSDSTSLEIFGVSESFIIGIDSTYVVDNNNVRIICEASNELNDDESINRDKGTAIVSTEADSIMSRPYTISKTKVSYRESDSIKKMKHKDIGDVFNPIRGTEITNNHYKSRSDVLMQDGILIQLNWDNSNASLLYPMMPVLYSYDNGGKVIEYVGVLHRVDIIIDNANRTESSKLTLFLRPNDNFEKSNYIKTKINTLTV